MKAKKELLGFEKLFSLHVKPQTELHSAVKSRRDEAWKEAMRKADENRDKAIDIFYEIYS